MKTNIINYCTIYLFSGVKNMNNDSLDKIWNWAKSKSLIKNYSNYENTKSGFPPKKEDLYTIDELNIDEPSLDELIPEIGELINLKTLSISNTKITIIPEELKKLTNLKYLILNDNKIKEIPKEIFTISTLI